MNEPIEHPYPTVDMTKVGRMIRKLHDQVISKRHRVEITRAGCDECCVMISKAELESLERAVAIFADTSEFNEMCENLKALLKTAGVVYTPQAYEESRQVHV